jgi:hypothetical protein
LRYQRIPDKMKNKTKQGNLFPKRRRRWWLRRKKMRKGLRWKNKRRLWRWKGNQGSRKVP